MRLDPELASIDQLIDEVYRLQAQVEALEIANGLDAALLLQREFGISPSQERILALLSSGRPKTNLQLFNALYAHRHESDLPMSRTVNVILNQMRGVLRDLGLIVVTHGHAGYELTKGSEHVRAVMRGETLPANARVAA